jgi:hypothetical protein
MNKVEALLNRIELTAKKLEMSVDDAISVLEGRHPTHIVVQKYKDVLSSSNANPTSSGPVAAQDATIGQQAAGFTEPGGVEAGAQVAAQNQAAAMSHAPNNED